MSWILVHNNREVCFKEFVHENASIETNGIKLEFATEQELDAAITELNLIQKEKIDNYNNLPMP